jgi:hypothetical protein
MSLQINKDCLVCSIPTDGAVLCDRCALSAAQAELKRKNEALKVATDALIEARKPEHYAYIGQNQLSYVKVINDALAAIEAGRKGQ